MDDMSFLDWMNSLEDSVDDVDLSGLVGMSPPEGAVKTGIFLADDQKELLALLRWQVGIANSLWQAYSLLTPADQKIQSFTELLVQCKRCELMFQILSMTIKSTLPSSYYGFVGIGFDDNLEIWVGPGLKRTLGDLVNPATLYPPKRS